MIVKAAKTNNENSDVVVELVGMFSVWTFQRQHNQK